MPGLTPVEASGLGWPGYEAYAFGQAALSQQGLYGMGQSHPVWSRGRQGVIVITYCWPVAADLHPGLKASNAELTLHPSHNWVGPFLGSSRTFDTDEQSQVSESMSCQVASPESVPVCTVHT